MNKLIDLHIHTNFSDGVLSPKEVIDEAFKNKVSVISIADHDTIERILKNYLSMPKVRILLLFPQLKYQREKIKLEFTH